ncbi:protein kinase [Escherichia phage JacobBurckhardt]|uniref:Protein kinase n=1 Tax=Escherichia phage JacobBurckhardt TaxID=2852037 RepID=A0AAE8B0J5_9CAUD|nr:protein kinase [Escherichia phage JacobBurckhardt]
MNITDIMNAIDAIKALPICELDKRQGMLIDLLVEMVNSETCDGEITELNHALEYQDWWTTLKCLTTDAGFKMLGNGHFSAAYSHPLLPNRVIKVGFKKEDSGAAYTAFCRMYQGRAGIPNVYDVQRHAGCYTVVLDALNDCERFNNDEHYKYAEIASDIIDCKSDAHDGLTGLDGEFVETCKLIRKFFEGIASFDMHSGNIMFDDNDVPYITDPVSFSQKKDGGSFSIDPEELIKEVEEVARQKEIDRAKERKARHVGRLEARRMKRRNRKARKAHQAKHERMIARGSWVERQARRNHEIAVDVLGRTNNAMLWVNMLATDFKALEERIAMKWRNADRMAIANGLPLNIDKQLYAMLMG